MKIYVCPAACATLEDALGNAGVVTRGGAELLLRWAANGADRDGVAVTLSPRAEAMLRGVVAAGHRVQTVHRALTPCPRGCCPAPSAPALPWWRRWPKGEDP